jgi:toxin YoeB
LSKKTSASKQPKTRATFFDEDFRADLRYWVEIDRRMALRVLTLVEDVVRDPFDGLGKPEPLKYKSANIWSRRVNDEHRLVYAVYDDRIDFLQARYHYERT